MRKATNRVYELIEQGVITHEQIVDMCMGFMSEDDVRDMLDANELSERFEDDGQPDEAQEWNDFDPEC
jgi:hypothetical protein